MKRFRTGLVVGKFCPLHRGHEFLIDTAVAQCDDVIVISYTKPEFAGMGPARRERWLRARFPAATVLVLDDARLAAACRERALAPRVMPENAAPADVHRGFVAWLCTALLGRTVDAVFTSEDYGDGFARALEVAFGHPVRHVSVDPARRCVPVSGTAVRANADAARQLLSDAARQLLSAAVYGDLVRRACFLGGESSGKSSMAAAFAQAIGSVHVPEYGRTLWEEQAGVLAFDDMLCIARTQVAQERCMAGQALRWLSCDTSPLTTLFYSVELFGRADPALERLAQRQYDAVFLCAPDFPFVQDGTRRGEAFRLRQQAWYVAELARRGIAYVMLKGSPAARLATVLRTIESGCGITSIEEES